MLVLASKPRSVVPSFFVALGAAYPKGSKYPIFEISNPGDPNSPYIQESLRIGARFFIRGFGVFTTLGIQIAQSRYCLHTVGRKVGFEGRRAESVDMIQPIAQRPTSLSDLRIMVGAMAFGQCVFGC